MNNFISTASLIVTVVRQSCMSVSVCEEQRNYVSLTWCTGFIGHLANKIYPVTVLPAGIHSTWAACY